MLVEAVPGSWLKRVGELSSRRSRKQKPLLPQYARRVDFERLRKIYRSYAAEKIADAGMKDVYVFVKGVGQGREGAIRALNANGLNVLSIKDVDRLLDQVDVDHVLPAREIAREIEERVRQIAGVKEEEGEMPDNEPEPRPSVR